MSMREIINEAKAKARGTPVEKAPPGFLFAFYDLFGLEGVDSFTLANDGNTVLGVRGRGLLIGVSQPVDGQQRCHFQIVPWGRVDVEVEYRSRWMEHLSTVEYLVCVVSLSADGEPYTVSVSGFDQEGDQDDLAWVKSLLDAKAGIL